MPFHQQCHAMFRLCLKIPLNVVGINLITLFTFSFSIARFESNAERTRAGISTSSFPADYLAGLGFSFSSGWKQGGFPDLIKNIAFGGGQEGNLWLWDCVRDSLNVRIKHLQGAIRVFVSRSARDRAASEEAALASELAASAAAQRRADDAAAKAELDEARARPPRHRPTDRALNLFSQVRSCGMRA
jgi:hypothetical protein